MSEFDELEKLAQQYEQELQKSGKRKQEDEPSQVTNAPNKQYKPDSAVYESKPKKMISQTVASSLPIKYKAEEEPRAVPLNFPDHLPAQQGLSYQDVLKQVDKKSTVKYVFPQHAPPKSTSSQQANSGAVQTSDTTWSQSGQAPTAPTKVVRRAAGEQWEDPTLADWDPNDYRIFVGDLGNEVNDDALMKAFYKYPSFQRARVLRDKKSGKSRGYGFVSFKDSADYAKAMREMNGKYIGNRPCKLTKSKWQDRSADVPADAYIPNGSARRR